MEVLARYGGDSDVAWKVGRIMLKFRPIAPKPVTGGVVTADTYDTLGVGRGGGRGKRKSGGRKGKRGRKIKRVAEVEAFREECSVVTLPLMPETPERKEAPAVPSPTGSDGHVEFPYFNPTWQQQGREEVRSTVLVVAPRPVRPVGSWVTVECVTDTWREGEVCLTLTNDEEVRRGLEKDACPGFISDPWGHRVTWTNAAYRRMVVGHSEVEGEEVGEEEEGEEEVRVALVTGGLVPERVTCWAFTCRVRVRYACKRRGKVSIAVPCDVWRLEDGGLAWRLDVKAALSLSLGS